MTKVPQDVRRAAESTDINDSKMTELILLMAGVLEKITTGPNNDQRGTLNQQTSVGSSNSWNDPKDTRRKARKSISTQFTKKMFSGKIGDNWDHHHERFVKACAEWEISDSEYVDYIQETLSGDALNYVEVKVEGNPNVTWPYVSKLMSERYNKVNRQKEISDRLH